MRRFAIALWCLVASSAIAYAQGTGPGPGPKTKVPVKQQPTPTDACGMLRGKQYLGLAMTSLAGSVSPGYVRFERKGGVKGYYWTQQSTATSANAPVIIEVAKAECKATAPNKATVQFTTTGGAASAHNYTVMENGARIWMESINANPPQSGWLIQMK